MSKKRMFSQQITESDAFTGMPLSTQALYFHLGMNADDDGFINSAKRVQRMVGASDDDLRLLIAKSFLIPFESGVLVVKHWRINNYIRSDRYVPTVYTEERNLLIEKKNRAYSLKNGEGIPSVYQMDTQYRLDKNRLDKCSSSSGTDVWKSLTSEEVDSLYEIYEDAGDLIQKVYEDARLKHKCIDSPYQYIIGFAQKSGWKRHDHETQY